MNRLLTLLVVVVPVWLAPAAAWSQYRQAPPQYPVPPRVTIPLDPPPPDPKPAPQPKTLSPQVWLLANRAKAAAKMTNDQWAPMVRILMAYEVEAADADRQRHERWFAQTEPPTDEAIYAELEDIVASQRRYEVKYLERITAEVLTPEQRPLLDAERLAYRTATSLPALSAEQLAAVQRIATEIVAQLAEGDRAQLMADRQAKVEQRVRKEVLTDQQRDLVADPVAMRAASVKQLRLKAEPLDPNGVMKYHDNRSRAGNPGGTVMSLKRLAQIDPTFAPGPPWTRPIDNHTKWEENMAEHLMRGDGRPGIVVSVKPLLVACFSDDLDAVTVLEFPQWLIKPHQLQIGSRLLAVNTFPSRPVGTDIVRGENALHDYKNVWPLVADFLTDDWKSLDVVKARVPERQWQRCQDLARERQDKLPNSYRDGTPLRAYEPAPQ